MFEGLATMVLTPAMALIQDDWIAQKIERTQKHAFTKHPETNSRFDVTQSVDQLPTRSTTPVTNRPRRPAWGSRWRKRRRARAAVRPPHRYRAAKQSS